MLENLTDRLGRVVKTLRGHARLTDDNVKDALREIRIALLEADVALPVAKRFIEQVREKALGQEVLGSLTPGQALVGVVRDELVHLMGPTEDLNLKNTPPAVVLMAGLQGVGKTTTCGKLGLRLTREKKRVLMVSCDVRRPAARAQLAAIGRQTDVDVYGADDGASADELAAAALEHAKKRFYDVLLVDTAGRLSIDQEMMNEIQSLHEILTPAEILFVVDAMQGQDAVNVAQVFSNTIPLTGVVLTKLDGDSRGGAALTVRTVTGSPIKFIGTGEKMSGLDVFHPERLASRILGMGDILSLVEDARQSVDEEQAKKLTKKIKSGKGFDLQDFREQMAQMQSMGGMDKLLEKLPASIASAAKAVPQDDRMVGRTIGIIDSMTPRERMKPEIIKASRKRRIASGAGVSVQEVNRLLNQFGQMQKMMKMMGKGNGLAKMMSGMKGMFGGMR
ncbi:MAG: signal recognition particle protein [Betaproteobacteria bacterium]